MNELNGMLSLDSSEPEKKEDVKEEKESLNSRFDRERKDWEKKIGSMSSRMNDIGILTHVLTEALSERQIALEYTHTLMSLLTNINAQLRKKRKERFLYYTTSYDQRLDKDPRNMFIDVDLERQVKIQETFSNHLSYMRGTVETIDKILYGCKWRLELESYRRQQH